MSASVYVDSSLVVSALYPTDSNFDRATRWFRSTGIALTSSVLTEIEVRRALGQFALSESEQTRIEAWIKRLDLVDLTEEIRRVAATVRPTRLRALDAIHVGTALLSEVTEFATFDKRQALGAQEMGLTLAKL